MIRETGPRPLAFGLRLSVALAFVAALSAGTRAEDPWVEFEGKEGPGKGKHIVLVSGDEEYRSEETLTQLAKILAKHHGFQATVLFAIDPATGTINPMVNNNIPGLEKLKSADLLVLFTRFRNLPDDQMRPLVDYVEAGRPIVGLRTATHAFATPPGGSFSHYSWNAKGTSDGGFGRRVLGETWISHHGDHGKQSTRGVIAPEAKGHPIVRGIGDGDIFGPSDVYGVRLPLPEDSQPLVLGQVLSGMTPDSAPVKGNKNDPLMPIAWTKTYAGASGQRGRVFTTTMGASQDFASEGLRRLLVNACYWAMGLEDQIPARSEVALVGPFNPLPFRHGGFAPGVKPSSLADPALAPAPVRAPAR